MCNRCNTIRCPRCNSNNTSPDTFDRDWNGIEDAYEYWNCNDCYFTWDPLTEHTC